MHAPQVVFHADPEVVGKDQARLAHLDRELLGVGIVPGVRIHQTQRRLTPVLLLVVVRRPPHLLGERA